MIDVAGFQSMLECATGDRNAVNFKRNMLAKFLNEFPENTEIKYEEFHALAGIKSRQNLRPFIYGVFRELLKTYGKTVVCLPKKGYRLVKTSDGIRKELGRFQNGLNVMAKSISNISNFKMERMDDSERAELTPKIQMAENLSIVANVAFLKNKNVALVGNTENPNEGNKKLLGIS